MTAGLLPDPPVGFGGGRIEWANALRGVAAGAVLFHHYAFAFFAVPGIVSVVTRMPEQDPQPPRIARAIEALPFDFGAFGVCLFFVLSGFVISKSLRKYSRAGFFVGRAMRLLPTYAVGFVALSLLVWVNQRTDAGWSDVGPMQTAVGAVPGLNILTGTRTIINGVVWTLIVELAFYAVCLIFFRSITTRWWIVPLVAVGCVAGQTLFKARGWEWNGAVEGSLGDNIGPGLAQLFMLCAPYLPILLVGVVLARHDGRTTIQSAALIAFLFVCFAWMVRFSAVYYFDANWRIRLTFGLTIVGCLLVARLAGNWRGNALASFFADISYPLYVLHMLLGWSVMVYCVIAGVNIYVAMVLAFGAAVLSAWILHVAVEMPSHRVGRTWARSIAGRGETRAATGEHAAAPTTQESLSNK